jgi:hypothetical protein
MKHGKYCNNRGYRLHRETRGAEMEATNPRVDKDTGSINIAEREQARTMLKEIAMICTPVLTTCMHEVWGRRGGH